MIHNSSVFDVRTIAQAKQVILTPEDSSTDRRWTVETPYVANLIVDHLAIRAHHRVLDYGCGIGRIAKALIGQAGCTVLGVDTSASMRALAPAYVESDRFCSLAPEMLSAVNDTHFAVAVWVLQHIPRLTAAVDQIHRKLMPHGQLLVVNMESRALPDERGGWTDDGVDVREHLSARFKEVHYARLDPAHTTPATAQHSFLGIYQRRD